MTAETLTFSLSCNCPSLSLLPLIIFSFFVLYAFLLRPFVRLSVTSVATVA